MVNDGVLPEWFADAFRWWRVERGSRALATAPGIIMLGTERGGAYLESRYFTVYFILLYIRNFSSGVSLLLVTWPLFVFFSTSINLYLLPDTVKPLLAAAGTEDIAEQDALCCIWKIWDNDAVWEGRIHASSRGTYCY